MELEAKAQPMIKERINKIFDIKVDAIGLSVFRMCYATVLLCEILQLLKYRKVIFDAVPFEYAGELHAGIVLSFYVVIILMLFFGIFTRFATIVNYIFGVMFFSYMLLFEYHVYYCYVGINFLLMFMPVSRVFSIDSLFQKIKYTNVGMPFKPDRKVLEINSLVIVFAAIGLVYIDSVTRKFLSPMWTNGLGMWLPSSLPMMVWNDTSFILNQEWLVKFLGYLVMAFELVFIFLFWFKRFRMPFVLLGMFFHLGILITYPIPWFALTAIVVYLLLIPQRFWLSISDFFKSKKPAYYFYYDAECPLCIKMVVVIQHFDVFRKIACLSVQGYAKEQPALQNIPESELLINIHGINKKGKIAVGYDVYVQVLKQMVYTYPLGLLLSIPGITFFGRKVYAYIAGNRLTERCSSENCLMPKFDTPVSETTDFLVAGWNRLNITKKFWKVIIIVFFFVQFCVFSSRIFPKVINESFIGKTFKAIDNTVRSPLKKIAGINSHPVFMYDIHFKNYNHLFKLVCVENGKIVPLVQENGMPGRYAEGAMWINATFRVNALIQDQVMLENGTMRYLRHFEFENKLKGSHYIIYVKEIETTNHWQKDFLKKQMAKPWEEAGTCTLSQTAAVYKWNPKMQAVFEAEKLSEP